MGRRDWVQYYDLGVTEATGGRMSGHYVLTHDEQPGPTGWHYHGVEMQFFYLMKGWFDIEFQGIGRRRVEAGDFVIIPGGLRHTEITKSTETVAIEFALGDLTTIACDPPPGRS
jgi:uncharacterized RmlC-like cupin family protein